MLSHEYIKDIILVLGTMFISRMKSKNRHERYKNVQVWPAKRYVQFWSQRTD